MKKLLIAVVLLVAVGVGAAFYLGWLNFSTAYSPDNSQSEVRLTLDKEKVKEDIEAVKKKARETTEKISEGAKDIKEKATDVKERVDTVVLGKTLDGTLESVDLGKNELTVTGKDGKDNLTVKVDGQTKIRVGDRDGTMADLKKGDSVSVTHMLKDGVDVALVVIVKVKS